MEANLPEEEQYKNFKRGFASPISVGDEIHAGGDSNHGIQTVAFNLPNDERVREAKGAKKVILQNVLGAKYDRILHPMASLVLVPQDAANVNKRYMYLETLFHELQPQPRAGLDHRQRPEDNGRQGAEGSRQRLRGSQGRRDGRLQRPLHDGQRRAPRRREAADPRRLCRRAVPRDALWGHRRPRQGRGDAIPLSARQGRDRVGRQRQALPDRPGQARQPESATWSPPSSSFRRPAITTGPRRSSPNGR